LCHEHVNWFGVTYEGQVRWEGHSCPLPFDDDDYEMNLTRPDQAGYPSYRPELHLEFDSDETADHFDSPWWNDFKAAVALDDQFYGCGETGPFAWDFLGQLHGSAAIVTGLMNIDTYHQPQPPVEIHPVWAMAINQPLITYDRWAFFVRNWGNEGFCGSNQEFAYFPGNQFTFRLPWMPGATSVDVIDGIWHRYHTQNPNPVVTRVAGQGVFVTFFLDPPRDDGSMWDGELHLRWIP
jgi:hypothetical protein